MSAIAIPPGQTRRPLRVLFVEDSETDALLLQRALDRGGFATKADRVYTHADMDRALREREWDVILADHSMPTFSAPEALQLVKSHRLDIPFIIVSGHIEEETAVEAMKSGAHDYIMKDRLARLVPVVERELREADVRRARARSEEQLRQAHDELEARVEQRTADLRATNLKLQKVLEDRRRLEAELLEIAEKERQRIGFDLHDDLGQKLTGAAMMIKGLEQRLIAEERPSAADVRRITGLMDEIIHHTHNIAHQFSSMDACGDGLASVLDGLAGSVRKTFNVTCGLNATGPLPELSNDTVVQLYKIAKEAVSNAIKHGKARHVSISVGKRGWNLVMTVKNDGIPFSEPAGAKDRMGLKIMNYRASTIGASLEIKPRENNGTVLTCALPLENGARPLQGSRAEPTETLTESARLQT